MFPLTCDDDDETSNNHVVDYLLIELNRFPRQICAIRRSDSLHQCHRVHRPAEPTVAARPIIGAIETKLWVARTVTSRFFFESHFGRHQAVRGTRNNLQFPTNCSSRQAARKLIEFSHLRNEIKANYQNHNPTWNFAEGFSLPRTNPKRNKSFVVKMKGIFREVFAWSYKQVLTWKWKCFPLLEGGKWKILFIYSVNFHDVCGGKVCHPNSQVVGAPYIFHDNFADFFFEGDRNEFFNQAEGKPEKHFFLRGNSA